MSVKMPTLACLWIAACGTEEVLVTSSLPACEEVDFSVDGGDNLVLVEEDFSVSVAHSSVQVSPGTEFDPLLVLNGRHLVVTEGFVPGDGDSSFCVTPMVTFKDPPAGTYEVTWYLEGQSEPLDQVEFSVD